MMKYGIFRCRVFPVSTLVLALTAFGLAESPEPIHWRSGDFKTEQLAPQEIRTRISELASRPSDSHLIVQFDAPVRPGQRSELESAGLRLLGYVGSNAYFASFVAADVDTEKISGIASLIGAVPIQRQWLLHPYFLAGMVPQWAVVSPPGAGPVVVGAYVLFHRDVPLVPMAVDVVSRHGATVRSHLESINGLVVELPFNEIPFLADEEAVQWIEPPLPRLTALNDGCRELTGANIVQAAPYDLDGTGVTVLVYDTGGVTGIHPDFRGCSDGDSRVSTIDGFSPNGEENDHATHVAGTIGGDGCLQDGVYRGMAPGVTMISYYYEWTQHPIFYNDAGDIEDDYNEAINVYGADISNNSLGSNPSLNPYSCEITGEYGVTSKLVDEIVRGSLGETFRVVWANGNERGYDRCSGVHTPEGYRSTAPPACAKNHITVGAVYSDTDLMTGFSSWGPCEDGRLKPDVCAPGDEAENDPSKQIRSTVYPLGYRDMNGTSMASPVVCGLSALLLQDFRAHHPGEPDFRNSTLKILLAHSAVDGGDPGPDYRFGYGSVRIEPAVNLMRSGNFFEAELEQTGDVYPVRVVVPGETSELKISLAWDDFSAALPTTDALVNDLDLHVYGPSDDRYYPWILDPDNPGNPATRCIGPSCGEDDEDHINNIEQVLVDDPAAGVWRVEIHAYSIPEAGPQSFSLCASLPVSGDCNDNGIADACDIDCGPPGGPCSGVQGCGQSADVDPADGIPDECDCSNVYPPALPSLETGYDKVRYISIKPSNAGRQTALRVTLTSLPSPFEAYDGTKCWVGPPWEACENAGQQVPPPGGCAPVPGLPNSSFAAAALQCEPHHMDWSTVLSGVVHVTDNDIVPDAVYDVQAIKEQCDISNEAHYSGPLTIDTSKWGDVVKDCTTCPCSPPDGSVGIATDVTAVLDKFKNLECAPMKARADIEPNSPDRLVNITDVTETLNAFQGFAYPAAQAPPLPGWTGPDGCVCPDA